VAVNADWRPTIRLSKVKGLKFNHQVCVCTMRQFAIYRMLYNVKFLVIKFIIEIDVDILSKQK
jgi:hypothetical protein